MGKDTFEEICSTEWYFRGEFGNFEELLEIFLVLMLTILIRSYPPTFLYVCESKIPQTLTV
jgi:hypothetical protein